MISRKSCKHQFDVPLKNLGGRGVFMQCSRCGKYQKNHLSCRKIGPQGQLLNPRRSPVPR